MISATCVLFVVIHAKHYRAGRLNGWRVSPEVAEFEALEELLRQRSGPGPYPFRLVVELGGNPRWQ
jgi:hypothetical protein